MKLFAYLLFLFVCVPMIELAILFRLVGVVGGIQTFLIIMVTGFIGAHLARAQGLRTLTKIKKTLQDGSLPAAELVDGLILLVAATLLITPGFLTDIFGFLLLLPMFRKLVRSWLYQRFKTWIRSGRVKMSGQMRVRMNVNAKGHADREIKLNRDADSATIDITADEVTTDDNRRLGPND